MRKFLWFIPCLLSALTCSVSAGDSVLIGVCLPLSGNHQEAGRLTLDGIRIANKVRPSAIDRPVELKVVDTKSDKAEAANALFRLLERDHVVAVIGETFGQRLPRFSHTGRRAVPLACTEASGLMLTSALTDELRVNPLDVNQAEHAARVALKIPDAATAAIIFDISDERSIGLAAGFEKGFTRGGGRIVLKSRIKTGDRDFTAQINQINTSKPDIVYTPLYYVECALFARQIRGIGMDIPMIAGDTAHMKELIEFGGKSVEDLILTTYFRESITCGDMGKAPRELCTGRTGRQLEAARSAGADAYFQILDAVNTVRSAEPQRIPEALTLLDSFAGVTGEIRVKNGVKANRSVVVVKVKDGRFVEWRPDSRKRSK